MIYRILADVVLILHLAFVLFVVLGGLLVLRWPRLAWLHVPAATWGVLVALVGWPCPLTPLENHLRQLGGQSGYGGGFIEHYIVGLIYPSGLTRELQMGLGAMVLVINLVVYTLMIRRRIRRRGPA